MAATVAGLHGDHARIETLWAGLRTTLDAWSRANASGAPDRAQRQQALEFKQLYATHLRTEETVVFPEARARIDAGRLAVMSADMHRRRQPGAS